MFVNQANHANNSEELFPELQEAMLKQRPNGMLSCELAEAREIRYKSQIQHRLAELEGNYFV